MTNLKKVEVPLMKEEEFKEYLENNRVDAVKDFEDDNIIHLITYDAVSKFKSVRRAIRRGHVSLDGFIYPKRPFNNRKPNTLNTKKKMIYDRIKQR